MYLLYLAYQSWPRKAENFSVPNISAHGAFMRELFINLTNPKIVLFFLSLLPQFIPIGSPPETFILYGIFQYRRNCHEWYRCLCVDYPCTTFKRKSLVQLCASDSICHHFYLHNQPENSMSFILGISAYYPTTALQH